SGRQRRTVVVFGSAATPQRCTWKLGSDIFSGKIAAAAWQFRDQYHTTANRRPLSAERARPAPNLRQASSLYILGQFTHSESPWRTDSFLICGQLVWRLHSSRANLCCLIITLQPPGNGITWRICSASLTGFPANFFSTTTDIASGSTAMPS